MASHVTAAPAVMEGGGSYNLHAKVPAGGAHLALPFLEQAARSIPFNGTRHPVVIADYGSSQGKNSLAPMRVAIRALRTRVVADRPIVVVHIDQAANDFNTLFDVLHRDPERYSAEDPNVFPSAIGRSFYERVFPDEQVDLGWSSYAAVWLSRVPALIPGHFMMTASTGEVRAAFERQGAEDWKNFLSLRAQELRPGGRLVVVLPGFNDQRKTGFEGLFDQANQALAGMVADGAITAAERAAMVVGACARTRSDLLAPFGAAGRFCGLTVEHCELFELPDACWAELQRDNNREAFAGRHAAFFRAIFAPSLASGLLAAKREPFVGSLEQRLKRRLAETPAPFHSFVQTMVLAKQQAGAGHRD